MKAIDETGNRYHRLTVVRESHKKTYFKDGRRSSTIALWVCLCDCGKTSVVTGGSLRSGTTRSCGCSKRNRPGPGNRLKAPGHAALTDKICKYRGSAKDRGHVYELTREEFAEISSGPCHYCAAPPEPFSVGPNSGFIMFSGIDRKDPKGGYVRSNCLPCCWPCNYAKADREYDEFVAWVQRAASHLSLSA